MSNLFEQIKTIASDTFQAPLSELTPESSPEQIPAWDSIQHLNLVIAIEERFKIQFEPDEMDAMKTLGDIGDAVERHLRPAENPA
jgi:acyl carrier protein